MDIFLLYVWTRLDTLSNTFFALFCGGVVSLVIFSLVAGANYSDYEEKGKIFVYWKNNITKMLVFILCCLFLVVIIPSKKDTAIIIAGKILIDTANSPVGHAIKTKVEQEILNYLGVSK